VRTPLVAGNWKMNLLRADAVALIDALKPAAEATQGVEVVVCPAFTVLPAAVEAARGSAIGVGAQNCYFKESGAFTGEISPQMLLDAGCAWVIIGHSERRTLFGEVDGVLNDKLRFALDSGLKVMFCIGETLEEREGGDMHDVLTRQVVEGLKGLSEQDFEKVSIAYEPVWAIGTGVTASPEQAQEAHAFVRSLVAREHGDAVAQAVRIQYGGSVKPDNVVELMGQPDVDGSLVGGASLTAESFSAIIEGSSPR
jgi:triosephosphate isomerase